MGLQEGRLLIKSGA